MILFDTNELDYLGNLGEPKSIEHFDVMESTGLKDKYETDLYDGDIVHVHSETETKTGHNSRVWITPDGVKIEPHKAHKKTLGISSRSLCSYLEFEIIGNIYETPELLSSDQNAQASVATGSQ
jgi:uncharacterized phage protein (TIGR01671 family)